MLYVPGNKRDWMEKAESYGADALVVDLEDSVPKSGKHEARENVIDFIARGNRKTDLFVRINALDSGEALPDLEAVVRPGLTGLIVPKVGGPEDIYFLARFVGWLEESAGLEYGSVLLSPILETAEGIRQAYAIDAAPDRVAYMGGIGVRGGG